MEDLDLKNTALCTRNPQDSIPPRLGAPPTALIAKLSQEGNELAKRAHDDLLSVSYSGNIPVKVNLPSQVNEKLRDAMREKLKELNREKSIKKKRLERQYMEKRFEWEQMMEKSEKITVSKIDEFLLKGKLGPSLSAEDALKKIRAEGGTNDGVLRWVDNIATIPDQDTDTIPPINPNRSC